MSASAPGSTLQKLLVRPEIGALVGAVVLFIFFSAIAPVFLQPSSLATVLYGSSTIGIMAVGVALLMIGGEFDLSTGVAVITSALSASMFSWYFSMNIWVGVLFALVVSLGIGFINGWILVKTKLPSFIVTLATFLMLAGLNLGLTRMIGGAVATPPSRTSTGSTPHGRSSPQASRSPGWTSTSPSLSGSPW
jgi:simple sugar transport system permease protein